MAFSSKRGRPRKTAAASDSGTPELRFKHAHGLTAEPIDLCLARELITAEQHRSGMHLRWLHTLRHGAPRLTTRYAWEASGLAVIDDPGWRSLREREYGEAVSLLRSVRRYAPVMRLAVFNEMPAFLDPRQCRLAWQQPALADRLERDRLAVRDGLSTLAALWKIRQPS